MIIFFLHFISDFMFYFFLKSILRGSNEIKEIKLKFDFMPLMLIKQLHCYMGADFF